MNLMLDEFVIMPNHFHGIIIIDINEYNTMSHDGDTMHRVSINRIRTYIINNPGIWEEDDFR